MYDILYEIIFLGASNVGKTTLFQQWNDLKSERLQPTIGLDYGVHYANIETPDGNRKVKLKLWDTAGQERFRSIVSNYFRIAHAVVLVYDTTDLNTLEQANEWYRRAQEVVPDVEYFLIGTKTDLRARRVFREDTMPFIEKGIVPFETNHKDPETTMTILDTITNTLIRKKVPGRQHVKEVSVKSGCCLIS